MVMICRSISEIRAHFLFRSFAIDYEKLPQPNALTYEDEINIINNFTFVAWRTLLGILPSIQWPNMISWWWHYSMTCASMKPGKINHDPFLPQCTKFLDFFPWFGLG